MLAKRADDEEEVVETEEVEGTTKALVLPVAARRTRAVESFMVLQLCLIQYSLSKASRLHSSKAIEHASTSFCKSKNATWKMEKARDVYLIVGSKFW